MASGASNISETARIWAQMTSIAWESQTIIALRLCGMVGLLPQNDGESRLMLAEKLDAAHESAAATMRAMARMAPADEVMREALVPYETRTRANASRLTEGLRRPRQG